MSGSSPHRPPTLLLPALLLLLALLAGGGALLWRAASGAGPGDLSPEAASGAAALDRGDALAASADAERVPAEVESIERPTPDSAGEPVSAGAFELGEITGSVVDAAGEPIEGASVVACERYDTTHNTFESAASHGPGSAAPGGDAEGDRTGPDGRFRLRVGAWRVFTVAVRAQGFAPLERGGCEAGQTLELVLERAGSLTGFVTDADGGAPVGGALVRVFHGPGQEREDETRTDARGRYDLVELAPGSAGVQVIPLESASPPWAEVVIVAGATARHDARVPRGRVLTGQVRDARTGAGIAGAEVSSWSFYQKTVRTDAAGFYRLPGVRTRPGLLVARAPGYGRSEVPFAGFDAFDGGDADADEPVDVELLAGQRLFGRIVDTAGDPLDAARVSACAATYDEGVRRMEWRTVWTGPGGEFSLSDVRRDLELCLFIRSEGHASLQHPVPRADAQTSELDLGDIALAPGARIEGRVLSAGGLPLADVLVVLQGPSEVSVPGSVATYVQMRETRTDPRGVFRLAGLAGGSYAGRLVRPAGASRAIDVRLRTGERQDREWSFPPGGSLRGIVRGPGGEPCAGALVSLAPDGADGPRVALTERTDEHGEFAFDDLPQRTFTLRARAEADALEGADAPLAPSVVRGVAPGAAYLELGLARADAWIEGRVVDRDGAPEPLAVVCVDHGDGARAGGVLANAAGRFRVRVPSSGTWTLQAWRTARLELGSANVTRLEWRLQRRILPPDEPHGVLAAVAPGTTDARFP